MTNIFVVNSDLGKNRGDRCIAEGVIALIRKRYPSARIVAVSEHAKRDSKWFDVDFLESDVTTLNPIKWLKMAREAARSDAVYWGGGELLKDYTNSIGLWYWCVLILWLRLFNRNLYGIGQGIGRTSGRFNRWFIAFVVRRTRKFSVRDHESYEKLVEWDVPRDQLVASSDPAILLKAPLVASPHSAVQSGHLDESFLREFVVIAPRNWFHYQTGGLIPYRFKQRWFGKRPDPRSERYADSLRSVIRTVTSKFGNVLLVPMHMGEDVRFCDELVGSLPEDDRLRVLRQDSVSPSELRSLFARARFTIGFRLHATIVATSGNTPALTFYYADKGRLFFEQLEQQENSFPIESLLEDDFESRFKMTLESFVGRNDEIKEKLGFTLEELRRTVEHGFDELHE
ncbi:MAG: polysaccharide pyruvyl transferase family protein [Planctomycetota bacterium]